MGQHSQVLVLTPEALIRRHPSYEAFQEMVLWLVEGEDIDRDELTATLVAGGYTQVSLVEDVGTFAIRGSIIDIFWRAFPIQSGLTSLATPLIGSLYFHLIIKER